MYMVYACETICAGWFESRLRMTCYGMRSRYEHIDMPTNATRYKLNFTFIFLLSLSFVIAIMLTHIAHVEFW